MTKNSKKFITRELISYFCDEIFDDLFIEGHVPHVNLPQEADIFLILPATANCIGKMANGIADDLLTSSILNFKGKIYVCPNMNQVMWENSMVSKNVSLLKEQGFHFLNKRRVAYEVATRENSIIDSGLPTPEELVKELLLHN